jgi:hypothetical protein
MVMCILLGMVGGIVRVCIIPISEGQAQKDDGLTAVAPSNRQPLDRRSLSKARQALLSP